MVSRKKGKPIKGGDRNTVMNVYEYFKKLHPNESVRFLVKKTEEATGTSERSIYRIQKQSDSGNIIKKSEKG